jgi:hypothetical protein
VSKKRIEERTVRVQENQVTHKLETTILDDVERAFERIVQTVDGQMLKLGTADRDRLARKVIERVGRMLPHSD